MFSDKEEQQQPTAAGYSMAQQILGEDLTASPTPPTPDCQQYAAMTFAPYRQEGIDQDAYSLNDCSRSVTGNCGGNMHRGEKIPCNNTTRKNKERPQDENDGSRSVCATASRRGPHNSFPACHHAPHSFHGIPAPPIMGMMMLLNTTATPDDEEPGNLEAFVRNAWERTLRIWKTEMESKKRIAIGNALLRTPSASTRPSMIARVLRLRF